MEKRVDSIRILLLSTAVAELMVRTLLLVLRLLPVLLLVLPGVYGCTSSY